MQVHDSPPSEALVRTCVDQVKKLLTCWTEHLSATLIQWLCLLQDEQASHQQRNADYLVRLHQEHDTTFGPEPFSALDTLSATAVVESDITIMSNILFTSALIKETPRLHPLAATSRIVSWEVASTILPLPNRDVSIARLQIYMCQYSVHRKPKIWGSNAHDFNPGRWLDEVYFTQLPRRTYRPV
jgi:cytochrome P450